MRKFISKILFGFELFGLNIRCFFKGILRISPVYLEFLSIKKNSPIPVKFNYPCFFDNKENAGVAKGHYFHQDLLVAQKIYKAKPTKHVDVGSRVDGFVAHVAAFREIEIFDIRKLSVQNPNILFRLVDFTRLPLEFETYCDSVSCLHALEHFGLGRYGDPIDPFGHIKGLENITKILKPNGVLYLSVPISKKERIEFNAHRVFSVGTILSLTRNNYKLSSFSFVDDLGDLVNLENLDLVTFFKEKNLHFGCGIFEFVKI